MASSFSTSLLRLNLCLMMSKVDSHQHSSSSSDTPSTPDEDTSTQPDEETLEESQPSSPKPNGSLEKSSDHNQSIFSSGSIGEWKKESIFAIILPRNTFISSMATIFTILANGGLFGGQQQRIFRIFKLTFEIQRFLLSIVEDSRFKWFCIIF